VPRIARAQAYPSRPVRIIVGFPPGGASDIHARLIAEWLSRQLGQSFVVENRPGAGGNIAAESVVRATPDGYTLLLGSSADIRNEILYSDIKFSFMRDTIPVGSMVLGPLVVVVHPSFSAQSIPELIATARSKPDTLAVASAGVGTGQHVAWELFRGITGVGMVHVPYRGGAQAITDLLGRQVQVYFATISDVMEHIKAGSLRALGVTSVTRSQTLPNVPTVGEFVPGFEYVSWFGVVAPRQTPAAIAELLNRQINAGLADSNIKDAIVNLGEVIFAGTIAQNSKFVSDQNEKWGNVIRTAGIKAE
jgi:tripartite-type tricarboxylate transporter receptor subunit TctC